MSLATYLFQFSPSSNVSYGDTYYIGIYMYILERTHLHLDKESNNSRVEDNESDN